MNTKKKNGNGARRYHTGGHLPIDLALLELLPDEGKMVGLKAIAPQVSTIKDREGFEEVTPGQISGRLKAMEFNGLVAGTPVFPVHRGLGWQRTVKGRELLEKQGKVVAV